MAIASIPNLFAVIADAQNLVLERAIIAAFPNDYIQIRAGKWFIATRDR
jgi:hypothetical protein